MTPTPSSSPSPNPAKFEDALQELERIIDQVESGAIGLEECLAAYERGMKLVTHCRTQLQVVEQRIAELTSDAQGKLRVADADEAGGDKSVRGGRKRRALAGDAGDSGGAQPGPEAEGDA